MCSQARALRVELSQKCSSAGEAVGRARRVKKPVKSRTEGCSPITVMACPTVCTGCCRAYEGLLACRIRAAAMATSALAIWFTADRSGSAPRVASCSCCNSSGQGGMRMSRTGPVRRARSSSSLMPCAVTGLAVGWVCYGTILPPEPVIAAPRRGCSAFFGQAQALDGGFFGGERALRVGRVIGRAHVHRGHVKLVQGVLHLGVFQGFSKGVVQRLNVSKRRTPPCNHASPGHVDS